MLCNNMTSHELTNHPNDVRDNLDEFPDPLLVLLLVLVSLPLALLLENRHIKEFEESVRDSKVSHLIGRNVAVQEGMQQSMHGCCSFELSIEIP